MPMTRWAEHLCITFGSVIPFVEMNPMKIIMKEFKAVCARVSLSLIITTMTTKEIIKI